MAAPSQADELAARLERGWEMVDAAERGGVVDEAARLFRHWERVLENYEVVHRLETGEGDMSDGHPTIVVTCRRCGAEHEPTREQVVSGNWRVCDQCRQKGGGNREYDERG